MAGSDGKPRGMKEYVDGLEKRVAALEEFRTHVWPGFNGPRCIPGMPAGEKIYGPRPAEPPGSPTVEEAEDPVRASDWLRELDEERGHPDQPRRSCWEVRSARGDHQLFATSMKTVDVFINNNPDWTKHRMVELREGEHIVSEKTPSMWTELTAERDQLQARVMELENAARRVSARLNEQRAALDHALDPKGGMATDD